MRFEAVVDDHVKYAWTAYKAGEFGDAFEEGLEPMDFALAFTGRCNEMLERGTELVVATADTAKGNLPVGLFMIDSSSGMAWPHVFWFPIASSRNRLEVTLKFLIELKKTHVGMILSKEEFIPWFRHLAKYGVLRQIGKVRDYPEKGKDMALFQTVVS